MKQVTNEKDGKNVDTSQTRLSPVINALFIGFLVGIVTYSIFNNALSLLTLIPLYFIYSLVKSSKNNRDQS
ncbi:hypothetical protein FLL45_09905 [Aliikangiella marina]|uniref:FUSC family protein n=1 Tax=Aliikangiella marina TaxID=1712262 RepID=A0A545TDF2_9GAMM|nr:hypothetical protein [Aliikangiella marina]TQV75240.1 hypothetical protein FLL45_09905 [Aliikangiella marina]